MTPPAHQGRGGRRAVFLDRDGTLVHPRHYPSRPEDLILYDGVAEPLRRLRAAGFRLVVVTNQSGLARGLFTADDLARMHDHLRAELAQADVMVDAFYHCPHHPDGVVPELAVRCDCRKPEPGMLFRAARDLDLDTTASWFLGDILDDVEAGHRAGCRSILVDIGTESPPTAKIRRPDYIARDTVHALAIVEAVEGIGATVELGYLPKGWGGDRDGPNPQPLPYEGRGVQGRADAATAPPPSLLGKGAGGLGLSPLSAPGGAHGHGG